MNNNNNMHFGYDQSNHMYNSSNPNYINNTYYGGNASYGAPGAAFQNAYANNYPMGKENKNIGFMFCSIFMIVSGIIFFFLDLIRKALFALREGKNAVKAAMNYDVEGAVFGAARTVSSAMDVLNHTVTALTFVMVAVGIVGIVFYAVFRSDKYKFSRSKWKIVPSVCGAAAVITSVVYAVMLLSSHSSFLICLLILAVIFITPILFTKTAWKFYKN